MLDGIDKSREVVASGGHEVALALTALRRSLASRPKPYDPDSLDARDPELIAASMPMVRKLLSGYLHLRSEGLEHVPRGPCLLVGNHNGGVMGPDLACTFGTMWEAVGPRAPVYGLVHDFCMRELVPVAALIQRYGALRASHENAGRALERGGQVLVYPGGIEEACRHFRRRNEVDLRGRTGFVRLAQARGVPLVPVVTEGAHRCGMILTEGRWLARRLGLPGRMRVDCFPMALALPWGLAPFFLPYFPLPFPIQQRILPPLTPSPSDDPREVCEALQASMQRALDELVQARRERHRPEEGSPGGWRPGAGGPTVSGCSWPPATRAAPSPGTSP